MSTTTLISICIPAYKRPENVDRLLHSIAIQTFTNFEIIITDDSPDESLITVVQKYAHLPIRYYKNNTPLGTPANWNAAIAKASGEWIKIMHDDDWFATEKSLEAFAKETCHNSKFIFSSYHTVIEDTGATKEMTFPRSWEKRVLHNPLTLLSWNIIGPPSVTLVHRSITEVYDTRMKWRVDIDFYVRILKQEKTFVHLTEPAINIGISSSQVTNYCINQPEVELPEGLLLLQKYGVQPLKNIRVFDTWWRIIRNVGIRNIQQLQRYTPAMEWPAALLNVVTIQSHVPEAILKVGVFSKLCMTIAYFRCYRYLNHYN